MGLLDIFRRKKATAVSESVSRRVHYELAHYVLRQLALDDPVLYVGVLASPDVQEVLTNIFNEVCDNCSDRGERPDFKSSDLKVHPTRINGFPGLIVEMPPPIEITEAYFTALVVFLDPSQELTPETKVKARYFTLELGRNDDRSPRTVLCEWDNEGSHRNFGTGPCPTIGEFRRVLSGFVNSDSL